MRSLITLFISEQKYRQLAFGAAFLIYFAVLVCGSIPGARAEVGEYASGLTLHLSTYAFIALLLFCGANGGAWGRACKSFLIVAAMGAVDEWVQSFFPYRGASIEDWLVDLQAALFTTAVLWLIWPKDVGKNSEQPS